MGQRPLCWQGVRDVLGLQSFDPNRMTVQLQNSYQSAKVPASQLQTPSELGRRSRTPGAPQRKTFRELLTLGPMTLSVAPERQGASRSIWQALYTFYKELGCEEKRCARTARV